MVSKTTDVSSILAVPAIVFMGVDGPRAYLRLIIEETHTLKGLWSRPLKVEGSRRYYRPVVKWSNTSDFLSDIPGFKSLLGDQFNVKKT